MYHLLRLAVETCGLLTFLNVTQCSAVQFYISAGTALELTACATDIFFTDCTMTVCTTDILFIQLSLALNFAFPVLLTYSCIGLVLWVMFLSVNWYFKSLYRAKLCSYRQKVKQQRNKNLTDPNYYWSVFGECNYVTCMWEYFTSNFYLSLKDSIKLKSWNANAKKR